MAEFLDTLGNFFKGLGEPDESSGLSTKDRVLAGLMALDPSRAPQAQAYLESKRRRATVSQMSGYLSSALQSEASGDIPGALTHLQTGMRQVQDPDMLKVMLGQMSNLAKTQRMKNAAQRMQQTLGEYTGENMPDNVASAMALKLVGDLGESGIEVKAADIPNLKKMIQTEWKQTSMGEKERWFKASDPTVFYEGLKTTLTKLNTGAGSEALVTSQGGIPKLITTGENRVVLGPEQDIAQFKGGIKPIDPRTGQVITPLLPPPAGAPPATTEPGTVVPAGGPASVESPETQAAAADVARAREKVLATLPPGSPEAQAIQRVSGPQPGTQPTGEGPQIVTSGRGRRLRLTNAESLLLGGTKWQDAQYMDELGAEGRATLRNEMAREEARKSGVSVDRYIQQLDAREAARDAALQKKASTGFAVANTALNQLEAMIPAMAAGGFLSSNEGALAYRVAQAKRSTIPGIGSPGDPTLTAWNQHSGTMVSILRSLGDIGPRAMAAYAKAQELVDKPQSVAGMRMGIAQLREMLKAAQTQEVQAIRAPQERAGQPRGVLQPGGGRDVIPQGLGLRTP